MNMRRRLLPLKIFFGIFLFVFGFTGMMILGFNQRCQKLESFEELDETKFKLLDDNNNINLKDLKMMLFQVESKVERTSHKKEHGLNNVREKNLVIQGIRLKDRVVKKKAMQHLDNKITLEESSQMPSEYLSKFRNEPQRRDTAHSPSANDTVDSLLSQVLCDDLQHKQTSNKVLSYSLYGKQTDQLKHFVEDVAKEALSIDLYKDFIIRIYTDEHLSTNDRQRIQKLYLNVRFCDVKKIPAFGDISLSLGSMWRFVPMADRTLDVFCSRDLDSPLLQREANAVQEWMVSGKLMHVMRDHPKHGVPVMGGMWCFRPSLDSTLGRTALTILLHRSRNLRNKKYDQKLLQEILWPHVRDQTLEHDSYLCEYYTNSRPFPSQRKDYFVGCVRDCSVDSVFECPSKCRGHPDWKYC